MERYLNLSGNSGVTGYEIGPDFIRVQFEKNTYRYDHVSPGQYHVDRMKELAIAGRGLGTYISKYVGKAYARKE